MSPFEVTREALAASLEQVLPLVDELTDEGFLTSDLELGISSVGAHLRHVGDAVDCLLRGLESGRVDFDARRRDERLERERAVGRKRLLDLASRVRAIDTSVAGRALRVSHDAPPGVPQPVVESTLEREMMFLASHCVHHYALVALVLKRRGVRPSPEFGVAVSTLRFSRNESPCAR